MIKAVYIHIPFCTDICSYCDFCKMFYSEELADDYLIALEKEVKKYYNQEKIETLYIGGGTPSSLSLQQLKKLFEIISILDLSNLKEFTIEVNPEDITPQKLLLFKENKVNRISIGHQTKNSKYINLLERKSYVTKEQINLVKKYFNNINIDLMYGFQGQTKDEMLEDLEYIISLDVAHISTYSLILEEHTKLFINKYQRLTDDIDALFYKEIQDKLESVNLNQYEISNFSKKGYESKHNLTYWNNEEYYGFGLGASGYKKDRYTNTRSLPLYLKGNYNRETEILSTNDKQIYEMILGLRKVEGVSKKVFFSKFGCKITESFNIIELLNQKLIEDTKDFIRIPKDKLYLENSILIHFLEVKSHE